MDQLIRWGGDAAALLGILFCVVSGFSRVTGAFYTVGGVEAGTLFLLGVGLMVFGCLTKLHLLLARQGR